MPDMPIDNQSPESTSSSKPASPKGLIVFIIAVLVLGSAAFFALRNNDSRNNNGIGNQQNTNEESVSILSSPIAQKTLVYGTWEQSQSAIKSLDLASGSTRIIAELPLDIKKVSILSPEELLYIDEIEGIQDHGTKLSIYSLADKKVVTSILAETGFGIDDYTVSPNKKYVATWEVAFAPNSTKFEGARSRVYAIDLDNPTVKNLLFDEVANGPVHYPLIITNEGKVFADKFVGNVTTGNSRGMSLSTFDGSTIQEIESMQDGTYSRPIRISPDGKRLLFAGYDGSFGDGKSEQSGFRLSALRSNTVELLDTNTLIREKVASLSNQNKYSINGWDQNNGDAIYVLLSRNTDLNGTFRYNPSSQTSSQINLGDVDLAFMDILSEEKILLVDSEYSESAFGNLGELYASQVKQYSVFDTSSSQLTILNLPDTLMQQIDLLPVNYFSNVLGAQTASDNATPTIIDLFSDKNTDGGDTRKNTQLYTFLLKADLAPVREEQQSTPRCRDLAAEQCLAMGFTDGTDAFDDCAKAQKNLNKDDLKPQGLCYDSPLYLYGDEGQNVNVTVGTSVYNSIPSYNNGYDITLIGDGKMKIGGKTYESISYDYASAVKRVPAPSYGTIVDVKNIAGILKSYATKLGLNNKETKDLINFANKEINSPYIFVSFFNHKDSSTILPLSFDPQPKNYLNVVFYFKQLTSKPDFSIDEPTFPAKIQRSGLTAIEVSAIIE